MNNIEGLPQDENGQLLMRVIIPTEEKKAELITEEKPKTEFDLDAALAEKKKVEKTRGVSPAYNELFGGGN